MLSGWGVNLAQSLFLTEEEEERLCQYLIQMSECRAALQHIAVPPPTQVAMPTAVPTTVPTTSPQSGSSGKPNSYITV